MAAETDPHPAGTPASDSRPGGPELRLLDRRAFIGFPPMEVAPGVQVTDFALQIPDVTFPFNVTGGPLRYQKKKLHFGYLDVTVDGEQVQRRLSQVAGQLAELDDLKLFFRPGYLEGQARLRTSDRAPVTFKVAFDGDGERLAVYLYDVRLFSFSATPSAQIPVLLSRALLATGILPEVELRGATGFTARVLPPLCQAAAVARGFKVPLLDGARLSAADVSPQGLKLRFSAGGLPPPATPDEELMLTLEGGRAFAEAEELLARGRLAEARQSYLRLGDIQEAHPFAAERLLSLLVADPQAHEMALDVAASLTRRRERSAAALWAEAVIRERRGESARAAERFLTLCGHSRRNGEEASAFFAAEAAARAAKDQAPQMAVKALHELLGLRPDHLPSLQALARASDAASDRAGAARAYRRIAALARDPSDAAEAHVHLAQLSAQAEDDIAGARLHCEAALRLAPDHPEALYLLGELCHRSGEHLRALKALDRLRDVGLGRHELTRVGKAHLLAGQVWEEGLHQPENALLRYREAVALLPHAPEPLYRAARVADGLGRFQEALAGYQQTVELAGPDPKDPVVRKAAHAAHHALAKLQRTKLSDPIQARAHLEAALQLDPTDAVALEELVPFFRNAGRAAELADALEKQSSLSPFADEPLRRAALLAEAGELFRSRLGQTEKAERLLGAALEADPRQRTALEGMLALAEARREGLPLSRTLKALADLSADPHERARYLRRLAVTARDLTFDLELAAFSLTEVLKLEPDDLPALGELCSLQRKRGDVAGLASALEQRARVAEAHKDLRLAAAALRELAQVLETRLGRVGDALVALEKAARVAPDAGILSDLADLSLRCERPEHARRALEDLAALLPRQAAPDRVAEVKARLARACEQLGDRAAAKRYYAEAFPLRRLDDALALRLETLYQEDGDQLELVSFWAARADALLNNGRPDAAAPLLVKSAEALMALGQRDQALVKLGAALDASPEGSHAADILERMAEVSLELGTQVDAGKLYARKAALLPDPEEAAALYWKAASLAINSPREESYLDEVLLRDPSHLRARMRRAERSLESAPKKALDELERVLEAPPSHPQAPTGEERAYLLLRATDAARKSQQPERALTHLSRYVAEHPEELSAQRELAKLLRESGEKAALFDLLGKLWPRLQGEEAEQACRDYCELALELQRDAEAMDALRGLLDSSVHGSWAAWLLLERLPRPTEPGPVAQERRALLTRVLRDSDPQTAPAWLLERAELSEAVGDLAAARADFIQAAQGTASPATLWLHIAGLSQRLGEPRAEREAWQRALSLAGSRPDEAQAQSRLLALAQERLAAQDPRESQEAFRLLLTLPLEPDARHDALRGLAEAARLQGDGLARIQALTEAAQLGSKSNRLLANLELAGLLETERRWPETTRVLEAALQLAPGHPPALAALARALRAQSDWVGLAELLSAQARTTPGVQALPLYEELGRLYLDVLQRPGPAEAAFSKIASLQPGRADIQRILTRLAVDRGDLAEGSRRALHAAAALGAGPGDAAREAAALLREVAQAADAAGDFERGRTLWRAALARAPSPGEALPGEALETVALHLYAAGAWGEALPLLRSAAQQSDSTDPESSARVRLALAQVLESQGDTAGAEETLRVLHEDRPQHRPTVERLAELLWPDRPREAVQLVRTLALELRHGGEAAALLVQLAERVQRELSDTELASELLSDAARVAFDALPVREGRVQLLRDAGRTAELTAELGALATLREVRGDHSGALAAMLEIAELAERSGRVDEALRTLDDVRTRLEAQGSPREAAQVERRRAQLLHDVRHDIEGAEAALARSEALFADPATAELGLLLARQRHDVLAQARWLERAANRLEGKARARLLLEMARSLVQAGAPDSASERAEAAAREAIALDPGFEPAERFLLQRLTESNRLPELAAYYEDAAGRATATADKVALLLTAADVYAGPMGRPELAALALLGAHSADPDNLSITARAAQALHAAGREHEAADFDALLLAKNPFDPSHEAHLAYLARQGAHMERAALLVRRGTQQTGAQSAQSYLAAAAAYREAGAEEQAQVWEAQAFEQDPANTAAFQAALVHVQGDVRRLANVLERRAEAVPAESESLLRQRATQLADAGEALLAAAALDVLLQLAPHDVQALLRRGELANDAGGPQASQPYDRRALAAGDGELPPATRSRLLLRLGHAALQSGALQDAADAFESVVGLDGEGERGQEALSLLAEVYARTQNIPGLYRSTVALARRAQARNSDEAEALWRRAAGLHEHPHDAIDAWMALVALRPRDEAVLTSAARALETLGRHAERVGVLEQAAQVASPREAAQRLLMAADVAEKLLLDSARARSLRAQAFSADPENPIALNATVEEARLRGDAQALRTGLTQLIARSQDRDQEALWRLELAIAAHQLGDDAVARESLWTVVNWGRNATGYTEALRALRPLLQESDDTRPLADVLSQLAELAQGTERAELLLEAGQLLEKLGEAQVAARLVQAAVSGHPTPEGFMLLARLYQSRGEPARAGAALRQAARLTDGNTRGQRLLEAADAFEAASEHAEARECLQEAAAVMGEALPARSLAARLSRLGAAKEALAAGFDAALRDGALEEALALAQGANDRERVREVLAREATTGRSDLARHALSLVLDTQSPEALAGLAQLLSDAQVQEVARDAWRSLTHGPLSSQATLAQRSTGLTWLLKHEGVPALEQALRVEQESPAPDLLWQHALLSHARTLGPAALVAFLPTFAQLLPAEAEALALEQVQAFETERAWPEAMAALQPLAEKATGAQAGTLWMRLAHLAEQAGQPERARQSLTRALALPETGAGAAQRLLAQPLDGPGLIALSEQIIQAGQGETIQPHRDALAHAYESANLWTEAARELATLPASRERLERRVRAAEALGHSGEALTLREQLIEDPAQLEEILQGYLSRDLHPPAVRLARRLLELGALRPEIHRNAAERLSRTPEGAGLATELWPPLLRERPADADGWTLYADALRRVDRPDAAARADGLGAALTDSDGPSELVTVRRISRALLRESLPVPPGSVRVDHQQMPRLADALGSALVALDAPEVQVWLDPRGGATAHLLSNERLVLGAGALAVFGRAELTFLMALALALGEQGVLLTQSGSVPALDAALSAALEAAPATQAAARVTAALDPSVRGADPRSYRAARVLRDSPLFASLARAVLALG